MIRHPDIVAVEDLRREYTSAMRAYRQYEHVIRHEELPASVKDKAACHLRACLKRTAGKAGHAVRSFSTAHRRLNPGISPHNDILRKARSDVRKMFVTKADRRELENAGVTVNPRYLTNDRNFPDCGEVAAMMEREYPALGILRISDLAEVVTRLFKGKTR